MTEICELDFLVNTYMYMAVKRHNFATAAEKEHHVGKIIIHVYATMCPWLL